MERSLCLYPASPQHAHQFVLILRTVAHTTVSEALIALSNGYLSVSEAASPAAPVKRTATWVADHAGEPSSRLSVVIPALNEATRIRTAIRSVLDAADAEALAEVIVVDGGSTDATVSEARRAGAQILDSPRGRGTQMNAGARRATGDLLLFLHADSALPADFQRSIAAALERQSLRMRRPARWGCFASIQLADERGFRAWVLRQTVALRTRWRQMPYGDQALFIQRDLFWQVGGYKEWPLMEDVDLVERLRTLEPPAIVPQPVMVSNRRWARLGLVRTTLLNQRILRAWKRGVPPEMLAVLYRESYRKAEASQKRVEP